MKSTITLVILASILASIGISNRLFGNTNYPVPLKINIPLTKSGELYFVEMEVEHKRGLFMLDFGSAMFTLNAKYFPEKIGKGSTVEIGGVNTTNKGWVSKASEIFIEGYAWPKIEALTLDLGDRFKMRDFELYGLVNLELFEDFEIELDYNNNVLVLYTLNKLGERMDRTTHSITKAIPIQYSDNVVFTKFNIDGKDCLFGIDTGAEKSLVSSNLMTELNSYKYLKDASVADATGTHRKTQLIALNGTMSNNKQAIRELETVVVKSNALSNVYTHSFHGLLGQNFISQGVMTLNIKKRRMYFQPYHQPNKDMLPFYHCMKSEFND